MTDDVKYKCSGCQLELGREAFHEFKSDDRNRAVTSRCKKCRSALYFSEKYKTQCACCQQFRRLDINKICKLCNDDSGLRHCKKCNKLLPLYLSFYGRSSTCKACRGGQAK